MAKYGTMGRGNNSYFEGVADGLNNAYKLVNEINDDYNATDFLTTGDEDGLQ